MPELTKSCIKCGNELPISAFHRNRKMVNGRLNACKRCAISTHRKYRSSRSNEWRRKECVRNSKWKIENREKHLAHGRVYKARANGKLIKLPCNICGNEKSEAHHEDYNKPLDVIWLCQTHHSELHAEATNLSIGGQDEGI